jgi:competence protein ComEC
MNRSKVVFCVFVLVFLVLIGFHYYQLESKVYTISGKEVTFTGKVAAEPEVGSKNTKLTVKIYRGRTPERVLIVAPKYPEYKYGDVLEVSGKLENPPSFKGFNYSNYLKAKGISFVSYYPKIELIARGSTSSFYYNILEIKNKLRYSIYSAMPHLQGSVLAAMILGDKIGSSEEISQKFNVAGISHIIAVSGLHIVIISSALMSLFTALGLKKKWAIYFSLVFIFLFIFLCGFQVSAVRAMIMGSLFLMAPLFGRESRGLRSITVAVLIMVAINPYILLYDVGFQLSFLATLGMIFLSSTFKRWLLFIPNELLGARDILSATFSAYVLTLPILIYNFGQVSLSAPLTNILILPVIPLMMISGFILALIGLLIPFLGWIISFIPYILLTYMFYVVEIFSKPWMAGHIANIHWLWLLISYLIIFPICWYLYGRQRSDIIV